MKGRRSGAYIKITCISQCYMHVLPAVTLVSHVHPVNEDNIVLICIRVVYLWYVV